jgi:3-oxoacyl-[acyl-carrier protein] reductase
MSSPSRLALSLDGQVALVTGAGQGVGKATATMLGGLGAKIAVNDFHPDRAVAVVERLVADGVEAVACPADVSSEKEVTEMFAAIADTFGPVSILVNNAGNAGPHDSPLAPAPPFWEESPQAWSRWLNVNLYGPMYCTHAATPAMIENGSGRVITVISDAGRVGEPHLVVYSGAKAGAAGFMRGYAKSVARYGITANCVALGAIRTPPVSEALSDEAALDKVTRAYPLRRIGEPEDPAAMITFLSTPAASWITGQTIPVNGGYSMAM